MCPRFSSPALMPPSPGALLRQVSLTDLAPQLRWSIKCECAPLLLVVVFHVCTPLPSAAFEMHEAGRIPYPFHAWGRHAAIDADRDGRTELYLTGRAQRTLYALEHLGGYEFEPVLLCSAEVGIHFNVWSAGDADRDGKTDVLIEYGPSAPEPNHLGLIEASDSFSLPSVLTWNDSPGPYLSSCCASYGYLDGDSAVDIAFFGTGYWNALAIYENTGDNEFELRAGPPDAYQGSATVITEDLDANGKPELVCPYSESHVRFYEAVANDSFEEVAVCTVALEPHTRGAVATSDMDRDGRPEVVAFGVDFYNVCRVGIIEGTAPGRFEVVWRGVTGGGYYAGSMCCAGDIDGDSIEEFAVGTGDAVRVFKCCGNDSFAEVWSTATPEWQIGIFDIDGDGRGELVRNEGSIIIIYAYGAPSVAERELRRLEGVRVVPSVVRAGVAVKLEGLESRYSVQVLDVAGRVVAEPEDGVWRTDGVSPGVYFFRFGLSAASCQPSAGVRKVLVVE